MQTNTFEREIVRDNIPAETNFSIKATGKAFRILSDGLYTDKILAIVRELSCNAYDAHVAAGNPDEPFDVNLPSPMDPTFRIRDYGIGLSKQDVLHLYTTYFESTKTNSNDFIGALGLGSKSPFSLVDSFVVHSFFNGIKMSFTAFISELGIPSITQLGEEPTDERNGLEVVVPVASSHNFSVFKTKATQVYRGFKVKPNVNGNTIDIEDLEVLVEGTNWRIFNPVRYSYDNYLNWAHAIQGNVVYPIKVESIPNCPQDLYSFFKLPMEVRFPIGELDVTASREALSMDQRTQTNIIAKFETIRYELKAKISKTLNECKTPWLARLKFNQLRNINGLSSILGDSFVYHGTKFKSQIEFNFGKNPNLVMYRYDSGWIKPRSRYNEIHKPLEPVFMSPDPNIEIWVDDVGSSASRRLEMNSKYASRYMFRVKLPAHISNRKENLVHEYVHGSKELKLLKGRLAGAPFRFLSELPAPTKQQSYRRQGKVFAFDERSDFFVRNSYYGTTSIASRGSIKKLKASWAEDNIDINEVPYVILESFVPSEYSPEFFGRMYSMAEDLKLFEGTALYGVRAKDAVGLDEKFELKSWLATKVAEYTETHKISEKLSQSLHYASIEAQFGDYIKFKRDTLDGGALPGKLFGKLEKILADRTAVVMEKSEQKIQDLAKMVGFEIQITEAQDKSSSLHKEIVARYPLLSKIFAVNSNHWQSNKFDKNQVVEYIEMVDRCQPKHIA